jgi:hypothetical protein
VNVICLFQYCSTRTSSSSLANFSGIKNIKPNNVLFYIYLYHTFLSFPKDTHKTSKWPGHTHKCSCKPVNISNEDKNKLFKQSYATIQSHSIFDLLFWPAYVLLQFGITVAQFLLYFHIYALQDILVHSISRQPNFWI